MNPYIREILKQNQSFVAIYVFDELRKYGINTIEMVKELWAEHGEFYNVDQFIAFGNKNVNPKLESRSITFDEVVEQAIKPIENRFLHLKNDLQQNSLAG